MLQRRKKYKNRTILGFKTLAIGTINMSQVLQKQLDLELELFGDLKESKSGSSALGKVYMLSLSSQPVDHEDAPGGASGPGGGVSGSVGKSASGSGRNKVKNTNGVFMHNACFCFVHVLKGNNGFIMLIFLGFFATPSTSSPPSTPSRYLLRRGRGLLQRRGRQRLGPADDLEQPDDAVGFGLERRRGHVLGFKARRH